MPAKIMLDFVSHCEQTGMEATWDKLNVYWRKIKNNK